MLNLGTCSSGLVDFFIYVFFQRATASETWLYTEHELSEPAGGSQARPARRELSGSKNY